MRYEKVNAKKEFNSLFRLTNAKIGYKSISKRMDGIPSDAQSL